MKLHSSFNTVEIQGQLEQGAFGIKQSPKAFQILSSGLYSNKPMAIIRELSANAADAHMLNGKEATPFEIKLPNKLSNQFYIKDFGPGLSHQQVMKLYTTYFDSTKSTSNDFIGGLGLGSKSPFSYTDTFTVESRQNGLKRTYSAFVGEDGIPQIIQLGDSLATNEPDGLTVGFPVNPSDYDTFQVEAQRILPWFDPMPTVLGGTVTPLMSPIASYAGLSFHKSIPVTTDSHRGYGKTFIKMGKILYPIDFNAADLEKDPLVKAFFIDPTRSHHAVFDVPIGDVEVAASREALQYDRLSKANLKTFFHSLTQKVGEYMAQELRQYERLPMFEASARVKNLELTWGLRIKKVSELLNNPTVWDPILNAISPIKLPKSKPTTFKVFVLINGETRLNEAVQGLVNERSVDVSGSNTTLVLEANTKGFIVATKSLLATSPTEPYYQNRGYTQALVMVPTSSKVINTPEYIAERDAYLKEIGSPILRQTSEAPPIQRKSFGKKLIPTTEELSKEEVGVYILGDGTLSLYKKNDIKTEVKATESIDVYAEYNALTSSVTLNPPGEQKPLSFSAVMIMSLYQMLSKIAKQAGLDTPKQVYGVTTKYLPRVQKAKVLSLSDWIEQTLSNPKVRDILSNPPPKLEYSQDENYFWDAKNVIGSINRYAHVFSTLGPGWKKLVEASTERTNLDTLNSYIEPFIKYAKIKEVNVKTIDGTKTYYKMFNSLPIASLALAGLTRVNNEKLFVQVRDYIAAQKEHDLDITFKP